MDYRPMLPEERIYTFSQSNQIDSQCGLIGYLRADMDTDGKGFFSSWNGYNDKLKTEEFKAEFDDVINGLRDGDFLSSRQELAKFCYDTPESSYNESRNFYGIRLDTKDCSYLMKLCPDKGDYNLYCYCFKRDRLERHMGNARQGIRFIDSRYNEKFRIADGDKITIRYSNGNSAERTCRYIDEYHLEVGSNLYHICEFAEMCERNGHTVEPAEKTQTKAKNEKPFER